MPSYRVPDLSLDEATVSAKTIAYYTRRFQHELWQIVVRRFDELVAERGFTQAALAHRLGKDPARINRWLAAPSNLRADTLAALLIGMGTDPRRVVAALPAEPRAEAEHAGDVAQAVAVICDEELPQQKTTATQTETRRAQPVVLGPRRKSPQGAHGTQPAMILRAKRDEQAFRARCSENVAGALPAALVG